MPVVDINYGTNTVSIPVAPGTGLGEAMAATDLPLEQPCAGRGTCGKCRVLVEQGAAEPTLSALDDVEQRLLSEAEQAAGYRLACRARVLSDVSVVLAPVVIYSNKTFRGSDRFRESDGPLGLAIDLGSTTVAALLADLVTGEVYRGAAALNQQSTYGADVISRLAAACSGTPASRRLSSLALASIVQAIDALRLPCSVLARVRRATIVGNTVMHHLLLGLPVNTLAALPFQPWLRDPVRGAGVPAGIAGAFPRGVSIDLPPVIGGFVGSDALACLAYFGFPDGTGSQRPAPIMAIDLGTNGEIMVTDGRHVLVASTAAGPAFEGVNISCGSRAVDGAIVDARVAGDGTLAWQTIGDEPPVGLTGSGLLALIAELRRVGAIQESGRFDPSHSPLARRFDQDEHGVRRFLLAGPDQVSEGRRALYLSQKDVRELQKSKGAVRAASDILLRRLGLVPADLERVFLTGSFGGQVDVGAVLSIGMIPPVHRETIQAVANGAGLGAARFLTEEGLALGQRLAAHAEQVELDQDPEFDTRYIQGMNLSAGR